ncbi:MAG: substrate-binding protein [Rhizobium sp.]|nr:substrate-binding protein [Rhizobium sp.]
MKRRTLIQLMGTTGTLAATGMLPFRAFAADAPIIAYAQAELINDWRAVNQRDMEDHAKAAGVKFISVSADQDVSKQLSDIQNLLAQSPNVLIVAPLESVALAPAVDMCNEAGVPLIVIDRTLAAEPGTGMYKTEITQSHYESGKLLAEKAIEVLTKKNGSAKGNVLHIQGQAGASPVLDSNRGWDEIMAAHPEIKTVATTDGNFTKEGGIRVMQDFLQRFPKGSVDFVRTDYSDMTLGAIEVMKSAGRTELLGNIVSKGGYDQAIEAVIRGEIARETQIPPYFGDLAIASALKIIRGEEVPAKQSVAIKVFDAEKKEEAQAYLDSIRAKGLKF